MSTRPTFTPLAASDFSSAFPASRKVHVDGPSGVRGPMREISQSNGDTLRKLLLPRLFEQGVPLDEGGVFIGEILRSVLGQYLPRV